MHKLPGCAQVSICFVGEEATSYDSFLLRRKISQSMSQQPYGE